MKQITILFLLMVVIASCKKNGNPQKPSQNVSPFSQFLQQNASTTLVSVARNDDTAREIGYSFNVSQPGTVFELGLRLPDTTHTYIVSLWDSLHHTQPLLQTQIRCNNTTGFTFQDVTYAHQEVQIDGNHTYVVSVNLTPVGGTTGAPFIFSASHNFHNPFFFTEGPVTYNIEYEKYNSKIPVFPDIPVMGGENVLGLVDIGFKY